MLKTLFLTGFFITLSTTLSACQHIQIAGNPIPVKSEFIGNSQPKK